MTENRETEVQIKHDYKKLYRGLHQRCEFTGKMLNSGRKIVNESGYGFMSRDFMESVVLQREHSKERYMNGENFYILLHIIVAAKQGKFQVYSLPDLLAIILDVNTKRLPESLITKRDFFEYLRFIENEHSLAVK